MEKSKIFTESEFNQRVKLFWDLMVSPNFPNKECPPIKHDRAKRKTRNLGSVCYKPIRLSFSYRMLDGRFSLTDIDNIIKHEIGHLLAYFIWGKRQGHNSNFKKLARKFDFPGTCSCNMQIVEGFKEESPHMVNYKYRIYCTKCGKEWFKKRKSKLITTTMTNPENCICPCKTHKSLKIEVL